MTPRILVLAAPPCRHGTFSTYCDWRVNWWTARHSFGSGPCPVDAWESEGGAIQLEVDEDTVD
jgi:hypothetical protein